MKRLFLIVLMALGALPLEAQTSSYAVMPYPRIQWLKNNGQPAAGYKLCSYAAGTSTPLALYSDNMGTTLPNPVTLNSAGIAQTGGGTETGVYIGGNSYKITLFASGTGNTCNGSSVGSLIRSQDNVYDVALLFTEAFATKLDDKVCHASQYTGANAGAKIAACVAVLPSTGGTIDVRGLEGIQAITSTVTLSKPIKLLFGASSFTTSALTATFSVTSPGVSIECPSINATSFTSTVNADGVLLDNAATGFRMVGCKWIGRNLASGGISAVDAGGPTDIWLEDNYFAQWGGHCVNTGGAGTAARWHVLHNTFSACFDDGILLTGTTPGAVDSEIVGNTFLDILNNSIDINGSRNRIIGNDVARSGCPGGAVDVFGIVIQALSSGTVNADDNLIANNNVHEGCGPGIIVRPDTGQHANRNLIIGNISINNSGTSSNGDGVTIDASIAGTIANSRVIGNVLTGNQRDGIGVVATVGTITDTEVIGNDLTNNSGAASANSGTRTCLGLNKINTSDAVQRFECNVGMAGDLIFSTTAATTGQVRLLNNNFVKSDNSSHNATVTLIGLDNSSPNQLILGQAGTGTFNPGGLVLGTATSGNQGDGTINTQGYYINGSGGATGTISVRKGDDSMACNLVFTSGLLTSTTC